MNTKLRIGVAVMVTAFFALTAVARAQDSSRNSSFGGRVSAGDLWCKKADFIRWVKQDKTGTEYRILERGGLCGKLRLSRIVTYAGCEKMTGDPNDADPGWIYTIYIPGRKDPIYIEIDDQVD